MGDLLLPPQRSDYGGQQSALNFDKLLTSSGFDSMTSTPVF